MNLLFKPKTNCISCGSAPYICACGNSLLFSPTKTPDGPLCQCQPNLKADLLHASDGFVPFFQLEQTTSKPPPLFPLLRVYTLQANTANGQNKIP